LTFAASANIPVFFSCLRLPDVKVDLTQPDALSFLDVVSGAMGHFASRFSPMISSEVVVVVEREKLQASWPWQRNGTARERKKKALVATEANGK
jgi:hypothetical protein